MTFSARPASIVLRRDEQQKVPEFIRSNEALLGARFRSNFGQDGTVTSESQNITDIA
jgi:hypothetical protein